MLSDINHYLDLYILSDDEFGSKLATISFSDQDKHVLTIFKQKLLNTSCSRDDVELAMNQICEEESLEKERCLNQFDWLQRRLGQGLILPDSLAVFGLDKVIDRLNQTIG